MIVGTSVLDRGAWSEAADTITLDEQARQRRRMAMVSDGGIAFLLDLSETRPLKNGDAIQLDDGRLIEVKSKPERLLEVRAGDEHHLLLLAWQIGSRHLAAEIYEGRLLIREDPNIAELLRGLGARLECVESGFDPQVGSQTGMQSASGEGGSKRSQAEAQ